MGSGRNSTLFSALKIDVLAPMANGVPEVLNEIGCPGERPHLTRPFLGLLDTLQGEACSTFGVHAGQSPVLASASLHFEMERQLVVQVRFRAATSEEGLQSGGQGIQPSPEVHVRPPSDESRG